MQDVGLGDWQGKLPRDLRIQDDSSSHGTPLITVFPDLPEHKTYLHESKLRVQNLQCSMRPTTKENCSCAFALFVIDALQFRLLCCVLVLSGTLSCAELQQTLQMCEVAGSYQSGAGIRNCAKTSGYQCHNRDHKKWNIPLVCILAVLESTRSLPRLGALALGTPRSPPQHYPTCKELVRSL